MTLQLYAKLGRSAVCSNASFLPLLSVSDARMKGINFRGHLSAYGGDRHLNLKRWFSRNFFMPYSQPSRFILSSSTPLPTGNVSSQQGDSNNLDRLATCDEICLVQKQCKLEETGVSIRKEYKYEIKDKFDDKLFDAVQIYETCPPKFDFKLYGPNGSLLITHKLLQNLSSHLLSMQIIRPGGMYLGSIEERLNLSPDKPPIFELKDSRDEVQAVVLTDFAHTNYGFRQTIQIFTPDQVTVIGKIAKKWSGFNDKLAVSIVLPAPTHMNVQFRASLIGLCILLVKIPAFKNDAITNL